MSPLVSPRLLGLLGLLLLALAGAVSASAQRGAPVDVTGTVVDDADGQPLPGANVVAIRLSPDSTRTGTAVGLSGAFRLALAPGAYRLRVSYVGYGRVERDVTVGAERLALGAIRLRSDDAALGEVAVQATRERVEVRGDTTAFNADAFKVNPDADAQDLLRKLPGVVIENGQVQAQGETVQRVLVDGREVFGTDVQGALRTLPAELVKEIQIFDRASEASRFSGFDDGSSEKTINIVTRAGMQNGQFGRAFVGAGPDGEYLAGGNISLLSGDRRITVVGIANNVDQANFANEDLLGVVGAASNRRGGGQRGGQRGGGGRPDGGGGPRGGGSDVSNLLVNDQNGITSAQSVGLNYSDKLLGDALTLTGSYVLNTTGNVLDASLNRAYTTGGATSQLYTETNAAESENVNHQLALRAQYDLSPRTQLIVQPRLSVQTNTSSGTLLGLTALPSGDPLARSTTTDASTGTAVSGQTSVLLRQRFATAGRTLTLGVDGGVNDQTRERQQDYLITPFDGGAADAEDQLFDTDARTRSLGATVNYTEPISERGQLQLSYRPQLSWSTSDQLAYLADGTGAFTLPDAAYTSLFDQQSVVQRAGVSYRLRGEGRDALSVQVGLDAQLERLEGTQAAPTEYTVDRSFTSILPSARVTVPLREGARLNVDYRVRTQTPSVKQLQDVVDNSNPLLLKVGNPALDPSTTHSLRLRLNATDPAGGSILAGFLSGSYGLNAIGTATTLAAVDTEIMPGLVLPAGTQLTRPENVDGAWDGRALVTYGRPVAALKSNVNLTLGASYGRSPGLVNGGANVSEQTGIDGRIYLGTSASERFDLSVEYGARYTAVSNSSVPSLDNDYVRHLAGAKLSWLPWNGLVVGTDLQALHYTGLDASVDPTQILWGAQVGYKFLQGNPAEVSLRVVDLLNQQSDVERTVTELYVEDAQARALGRYVMLNLSYKLRNFGL